MSLRRYIKYVVQLGDGVYVYGVDILRLYFVIMAMRTENNNVPLLNDDAVFGFGSNRSSIN